MAWERLDAASAIALCQEALATGAGDPHGDAVDPALAAITAEEVLAAAERLLGAVRAPA